MVRKIAKRTPEPVPEHRTISQFESLSDAEKEQVWEFYDAKDVRSGTRPMTPAERAQWDQVQTSLKTKRRLRGRPRVGKGAEVVAVSIEKALLDRADAYGRQHGLGRSEVFVLGIKAVVRDATSKGTG
jgi:hypothetical protein